MNWFFPFLMLTVISVILSMVFAFNVYESGKIVGRHPTSRMINRHKKWVDSFLFSVVASVLLIESLLLVKRGVLFDVHLLDTLLGQIHLGLDVIFLISAIIMRCLITGEDNKEIHRKISKVLLGSYLCILVTGMWLLSELLIQV